MLQSSNDFVRLLLFPLSPKRYQSLVEIEVVIVKERLNQKVNGTEEGVVSSQCSEAAAMKKNKNLGHDDKTSSFVRDDEKQSLVRV